MFFLLFNITFKTEAIPYLWKKSKIIPDHKKSNGQLPSVTLINKVSKVLKRVLYNRSQYAEYLGHSSSEIITS